MNTIVKIDGVTTFQRKLPFSINDIVKVVSYGNVICTPEVVNKLSSFYRGTPLNVWQHINCPYHECDEKFGNVQWKVVDVGVCRSILRNVLVIKLVNRNREELLLAYNPPCLKVVRKGKKNYSEYIIDAIEL